jgi:hypothetical protein
MGRRHHAYTERSEVKNEELFVVGTLVPSEAINRHLQTYFRGSKL